MSRSPSNPKGTKDFLPSTLSKRNYIIDIIKDNFKLFGFLEIETPHIPKIIAKIEEGQVIIYQSLYIIILNCFIRIFLSGSSLFEDSMKYINNLGV